MRLNAGSRALPVDFDRDLKTRNKCIAVLVVSWLSAIAAIAQSGYLMHVSFPGGAWIEVGLSPLAVDRIALALNIFVTSLNAGLGFIHAASLRRSLQQEGKLQFNTNLRLFTSSQSTAANGRLANAVVLICIVLCYSAPSLLFATVAKEGNLEDLVPAAELNVIALLFLGLGFLGQSIIATWALLVSNLTIPTWSSNPVEAVKACLQGGSLSYHPDRCIMGVTNPFCPPEPRHPLRKQPSMFSSHREVNRAFLLIRALVPVGGIWFGIIYYFVFTWPVRSYGSLAAAAQNWSPLPIGAPYTVWSWRWPRIDGVNTALAALALVFVLQGVLTLVLHCVELVVNLHRDEVWWRKATSASGCRNSKYDSISHALTSWMTVTLFLFKAVIHWFFALTRNLGPGAIHRLDRPEFADVHTLRAAGPSAF